VWLAWLRINSTCFFYCFLIYLFLSIKFMSWHVRVKNKYIYYFNVFLIKKFSIIFCYYLKKNRSHFFLLPANLLCKNWSETNYFKKYSKTHFIPPHDIISPVFFFSLCKTFIPLYTYNILVIFYFRVSLIIFLKIMTIL
jgi:hypothetical protein